MSVAAWLPFVIGWVAGWCLIARPRWLPDEVARVGSSEPGALAESNASRDADFSLDADDAFGADVDADREFDPEFDVEFVVDVESDVNVEAEVDDEIEIEIDDEFDDSVELAIDVEPSSNVDAARQPVSIIIPARNEAESLPRLLDRIVPWVGDDDEVIVVDDRSSDATAAIAEQYGVMVIRSPGPRRGWLGKPNACWLGQARAANDTLVFLDADVRPSTDFFERIQLAVAADGCSSVLPWHQTVDIGEQVSLFPSIAALMGSGTFSIVGRGSRVAFGPVMAFRRDVYDSVGGHSAPTVHHATVEDVALAQLLPHVGLYVGVRRRFWQRADPACVSYRMYPQGASQAFSGWTRTLSTGLTSINWWALLATFGWIWAMAAAPFVGWWAYALSVVQVGVIGRLAGRFRWWTSLVYPALLVVFVAMVATSIVQRVSGRPVTWKDRRVRI